MSTVRLGASKAASRFTSNIQPGSLNISLVMMKGETIQCYLPPNFKLADFKNMLSQHFDDPTQYRFVAGSKQIDLTDEIRFNALKSLITNGTTIFVLQRMQGGAHGRRIQTDHMDIPTLITHIQNQLPAELSRMPKQNNQCIGCRDNCQCIQVHCNWMCSDCFPTYYKTTNYNLKCSTCHQKLDYNHFFVSPFFRNLIKKLVDSRNLLHNIDCQICRCGALLMNDTMYSQQTCRQCDRTMCFFCNKDWNASLMRNDKFTCHYNCDYETRITYELVPCLQFNPNLQIPNRRCCPKCFHPGAFGERCKYHTCYACGYTFCFLCLEAEDACKRKYNTNNVGAFYGQPCVTTLRQQTYQIFPRMNS